MILNGLYSLCPFSGGINATNIPHRHPDCLSTFCGGIGTGISKERVGDSVEALLLAVMGAVNVLCFIIGARVGMAVKKDEEIKLPSANPVEAVKEHINKREARAEQDKIDKIMQNIERYDGSPNGQIDVG